MQFSFEAKGLWMPGEFKIMFILLSGVVVLFSDYITLKTKISGIVCRVFGFLGSMVSNFDPIHILVLQFLKLFSWSFNLSFVRTNSR